MVFAGTGTHGIYHAGVLRALQEAGVRIDIIAGHGVGAVTAAFAAIDGGAALWDEGGPWRSPRSRHFYRWRWPLRVSARLAVLLAAAFAVPVVVLLASAAAYLTGFVLTLAGLDAGSALVLRVSSLTGEAFSGPNLPTVVPRAVMLVVLAMGALLAYAGLGRPARAGMGRMSRGSWWWFVASSPLELAPLRSAVSGRLWDLVRGAATAARPTPASLSRRYAETLQENLGQPACRELMLAVTDLDARRDVVGAVLGPDARKAWVAPIPGRSRESEIVDLAGEGCEMLADFLSAAVTPSVGAAPHPLVFPSEGYWAGESHRACDRPGMLLRLLAELDRVDATQVIVVSAAAPQARPFRLPTPPVDPRARLGEYMMAAEAASFDDAVIWARERFDAVFTVSPEHNPIGPFDFGSAYDEGADRVRASRELLDHGYRDAHRQFIDPVVGAGGEQMAPVLS